MNQTEWETCQSGERMADELAAIGISSGIYWKRRTVFECYLFKPMWEAGSWLDKRFNSIWKRFDAALADDIRKDFPTIPYKT